MGREMTTASAMTINATTAMRTPKSGAHQVGRDAAMILGVLLWVSTMVFMLMAVTSSWANAGTIGAPTASPAPAPILQPGPVGHDAASGPAAPQPGFAPR